MATDNEGQGSAKQPERRGGKRDRLSVDIPLPVRLFFLFDGKLIRRASTTRAMAQYLMARAIVPENVEPLRQAILFEAERQAKNPYQFVLDTLIEERIDIFGEDLEQLASALCELWNLPTTGND